MAIINQIGGISTGGLTGVIKGPLEKLFGKGQGANMYQYPNDLGNDPSRMHIVQFSVCEVEPAQFTSKNIYEVASGIGEAGQGAYNLTAGAITSDTKQFQQGAQQIKGTTEVAQNLEAYLKPQKTIPKATISLYMPDTLSMNYHAEYSELSLSDATNNMNRVAGAIGSLINDLADGGINSENMKNAITKNTQKYGPELALRMADRKFGTNLTDLGMKALGKAINPQLQLIYKGVGFRTFTMEFLFTPKTKGESDQVSAIVNTFIYASSPKIIEKGMYFTPPSIFNISMMTAKTGSMSGIMNLLQKAGNNLIPGVPLGNLATGQGGVSSGVENDRLFKVGDCVLEDVSVDYAPNGWAAYGTGAPVQTRLNLSFKEIDIIDRTRMEKGEVR